MKKFTRILSLTLVLVMSLAILASCGTRLSGTYSDKLGLTKWTFDGDKVTYKALIVEVETTYKIKDGKIILDLNEKLASALNLSKEDAVVEWSFEKDGDTITINGVDYTKEK